MPFGRFFFKLTICIAYFTPLSVELMLFLHATNLFSLSFVLEFTKKIIYPHTYAASYCINSISRYGFIDSCIIYATDVELPGMNVILLLLLSKIMQNLENLWYFVQIKCFYIFFTNGLAWKKKKNNIIPVQRNLL